MHMSRTWVNHPTSQPTKHTPVSRAAAHPVSLVAQVAAVGVVVVRVRGGPVHHGLTAGEAGGGGGGGSGGGGGGAALGQGDPALQRTGHICSHVCAVGLNPTTQVSGYAWVCIQGQRDAAVMEGASFSTCKAPAIISRHQLSMPAASKT